MKFRLLEIRPGERRNAIIAFLSLFGLMAGHALLETARDALFLSRLSPTRLPIVYLIVAALALAANELQQRFRGRRTGKTRLAIWLVAVAVGNLAFWLVLPRAGSWSLYALYVWSGLVSTLLVIRFWIVAGDLFTVTQAKRLFAFVGTGSILGAIAGSALAVVLSSNANNLLPAAAAVLLATAVLPLCLRPPESEPTAFGPGDDRPATLDLAETFRAIRAHPYVSRVALLVFFSTIAFTMVDYIFKSNVAEAADNAAQMSMVFAATYLVLNVLSLVMQLAFVGWVTRVVPIDRLLAIVPVLIAIGAGAVMAGGGWFAAQLVKGIDGAFRHSLHRTSTEVLYVPLSREWRNRAKSFIDVVGQRGGQAFGSLLLLAVAAWTAPPPGESAVAAAAPVLGGLLALASVAWLWSALGLKRPYFNLFRDTLDEGALRRRIAYPDLDLSSLESLMRALSSPDDLEVVAALELLAETRRHHLIPPLILYHPSGKVVVRALELMEEAGRISHCRMIDRLLENEDDTVRVAALLAIPEEERTPERFEAALADPSADVRATALVCLLSIQKDPHPRVQSILDTTILAGSVDAKCSLARTIRVRPSARFDGVLMSLASHPHPRVGAEVARAMQAEPKATYVPTLLQLLASRDTRGEARSALAAIGDPALEALQQALADPSTPEEVRLHVPRTISRFPAEKAAPVLLQRLPVETHGTIRYKLLRALGAVRVRNPEVKLDHDLLEQLIQRTMTRLFQMIEFRVQLERQESDDPAWRTPVSEDVRDLLRSKELHATERLFRLFSLRFPNEDFRRIHRGLTAGGRSALASSRELLENALPSPIREAILGYLDDVPDARRLAAGSRYHRATQRSPRELLQALLEEPSLHLRCLVAHHVKEMNIPESEERIHSLCERAQSAMKDVFRRSLEPLKTPGATRAFVVPIR